MIAAENVAPIKVRSIWQKDKETLAIEWTDGLQQNYSADLLRMLCPCAACVDEFTGKRTLKKEEVPKNLRPQQVFSVGRYALGISFSDGHKTGIYTFDYLRSSAFSPVKEASHDCSSHSCQHV